MKTISIANKLKSKFDREEIFTTENFFSMMNDCPKSTVYSRINALLKKGFIQKVGQGQYKLGKSNFYEFEISSRMQKVYKYVVSQFSYINVCVWNLSAVNNFSQHLINYNVTFIDVDRDAVEAVYWALKETYSKVITTKKMYDSLSEFKDFIIVRPLVTSSPLQKIKSLQLPTMEKWLVDIACDKEFLPFQGNEITHIFKTAFDRYTINESRMLRYAGRKMKQGNIKRIIEVIKRQ